MASSRRSPFLLSFFDKSFSNFLRLCTSWLLVFFFLLSFHFISSQTNISKTNKNGFYFIFIFDAIFHRFQLSWLISNSISQESIVGGGFSFCFCHFDESTNDMQQHKWNKLCWKSHLRFGDLIYMWFTELFAACFKFILIILCVCLPMMIQFMRWFCFIFLLHLAGCYLSSWYFFLWRYELWKWIIYGQS